MGVFLWSADAAEFDGARNVGVESADPRRVTLEFESAEGVAQWLKYAAAEASFAVGPVVSSEDWPSYPQFCVTFTASDGRPAVCTFAKLLSEQNEQLPAARAAVITALAASARCTEQSVSAIA